MLDALDLLTLHAPAGNGQVNEPADIAALDASLRRIEAYTPPPEYAAEPQRYPTAPLIRALEGFREQNGLKIDGYANPGGPTERAINNRLLAKPRGAGLLFDPPAPLAGTVGNGFDNRPADVAAVQRLLGAAGDLPEDPFDRPRGYIDESTTRAIQSYQRKAGLADDGWLAPNGEIERALRAAAADLARAKAGDWLEFADRAGRAQARLSATPENRLLASGRRTNGLDRHPDLDTNAEPEGAITPVQSRGALGRIPAPAPPWIGVDPETDEITPGSPADLLRRFFDSAGRYRGRLMLPGISRRESLPETDRSGGRTILVPPRVPDEPFRGPDPAKPPLDPKLTRPSPYPSESPHKPEPERIVPPRIDPRDHVESYPDQSDEIRTMPNVLKMEEDAKIFSDRSREDYVRRYREWWGREGAAVHAQTEADRKRLVSPAESFIWQNLEPHRGRTKTNGLSGRDKRFYEYDYGKSHPAQIEVYDAEGYHLMAINPVTGAIVHGPVKGRTIPIKKSESNEIRFG